MERQHQGMDRPGVRQVPEDSGEQGNMEETGCEIICGAPTTLAVKKQMMMMRCMRRGIITLCGLFLFPSSFSSRPLFSAEYQFAQSAAGTSGLQ